MLQKLRKTSVFVMKILLLLLQIGLYDHFHQFFIGIMLILPNW